MPYSRHAVSSHSESLQYKCELQGVLSGEGLSLRAGQGRVAASERDARGGSSRRSGEQVVTCIVDGLVEACHVEGAHRLELGGTHLQ